VVNCSAYDSLVPFRWFCCAQDPERLHLLAGLLLCSEQCVIRMAQKYPELLTMDPAEVTQRLMLLKVNQRANATALRAVHMHAEQCAAGQLRAKAMES